LDIGDELRCALDLIQNRTRAETAEESSGIASRELAPVRGFQVDVVVRIGYFANRLRAKFSRDRPMIMGQ